jgi:hypothetical protein
VPPPRGSQPPARRVATIAGPGDPRSHATSPCAQCPTPHSSGCSCRSGDSATRTAHRAAASTSGSAEEGAPAAEGAREARSARGSAAASTTHQRTPWHHHRRRPPPGYPEKRGGTRGMGCPSRELRGQIRACSGERPVVAVRDRGQRRAGLLPRTRVERLDPPVPRASQSPGALCPRIASVPAPRVGRGRRPGQPGQPTVAGPERPGACVEDLCVIRAGSGVIGHRQGAPLSAPPCPRATSPVLAVVIERTVPVMPHSRRGPADRARAAVGCGCRAPSLSCAA